MTDNGPSDTPKSSRKRKAKSEDESVMRLGDPQTTPLDYQPVKKRLASIKRKAKATEKIEWSEYFDSLFKVYKALNTVLAFCSSRKHLATTFPVVRSSVEALMKQPLELVKVAELKALLPDLIKFAYIPRNELLINAETQSLNSSGRSRRRADSPDFQEFVHSGSVKAGAIPEEEEHVLVLDFAENARGKKSDNPGFSYALPPALSPQAVKKLVEKRNERFVQAVDELILATPPSEDAALILQSAARAHIPVDPGSSMPAVDDKGKGKITETLRVPDSANRPTIDTVISDLMMQEWYHEQIIERRVFDKKEGQIGIVSPHVSESILQALKNSRKIVSFYTHQATAINAVDECKNVIVSTSTASGKSVIYQVPVLRFLEEDTSATAIFIYPTKALAQDQRTALEQLLYACPGLESTRVATYDGDTPQEQRADIRENASVIFTNFDMIHTSILPHEDTWRRFLKDLKLVAVDELHYYSGIFGSHVAQVLRRFRRVCAAIGNRRIRFVSCSATIANPQQHMKKIFGIDNVEVITEDGAPAGRKDFLVWNPPLIDPVDPSLGRVSSMSEATGLMRFLMKRGVRVILFCKIRRVCEMAMKALRTELSSEGRLDILERVMAYRGGYSNQDRRRIEHEAFSGNLLGIVATNALELGVDIGVLDAVIMLGFPFGIANLRQQAGRAGRRARDALAVLVADSLPLDQHYVQHPDEIFSKPTDNLLVDLESKVILEAHLQCAAHEMPLTLEDEQYFGPLMKEVCETQLRKDKEGWFHTHPKFLPFPARHVAIRSIEEERYTVVDISRVGLPGGEGRLIEEVELSRALFELYEGAVFIHQGLTFMVKEVSHDSMIARVIRVDVNWITRPRDFTNVDPIQTYRIREIKDSPERAFYGRVDLKTIIFGYFKLRNKTILDAVDLEMPPYERDTTGLWINVPHSVLEVMRLRGINPAEAIHSAQHAFLNRFAMGMDLRTECKVPQKEYKVAPSQRKRPGRLIFYDLTGKGGGVAAKAFDHVSNILHDAFRTVDSCDCEEGCAVCIQSAICKEGNVVSSKIGALVVLRGVLGLPVDADDIPDQSGTGYEFHNTVVEASAVRSMEGVELECDLN